MKWTWLEKMPSTNLRILLSLLLAAATGARVVFTDWEPPMDWLAFLTLWAGLDVVQFVQKRKTHRGGEDESSVA